jgi:hypothetical protein
MKKKTVNVWAVLDEQEHSAIGGLTFYSTRSALFVEYNVRTPKEWEENIGWKYFPVTITYELP